MEAVHDVRSTTRVMSRMLLCSFVSQRFSIFSCSFDCWILAVIEETTFSPFVLDVGGLVDDQATTLWQQSERNVEMMQPPDRRDAVLDEFVGEVCVRDATVAQKHFKDR